MVRFEYTDWKNELKVAFDSSERLYSPDGFACFKRLRRSNSSEPFLDSSYHDHLDFSDHIERFKCHSKDQLFEFILNVLNEIRDVGEVKFENITIDKEYMNAILNKAECLRELEFRCCKVACTEEEFQRTLNGTKLKGLEFWECNCEFTIKDSMFVHLESLNSLEVSFPLSPVELSDEFLEKFVSKLDFFHFFDCPTHFTLGGVLNFLKAHPEKPIRWFGIIQCTNEEFAHLKPKFEEIAKLYMECAEEVEIAETEGEKYRNKIQLTVLKYGYRELRLEIVDGN